MVPKMILETFKPELPNRTTEQVSQGSYENGETNHKVQIFEWQPFLVVSILVNVQGGNARSKIQPATRV